MYYPYIPDSYYRQEEDRRMTVTGVGEVLIAPNQMMIQFEVQTEDESLDQAQQENRSRMTQVIDTLIQMGISRENIQTTGFTIFPMYDYVDGEQVFRGYQVTNTITVQLDNVNQAGYMIDTAVSSGVNRVSNIRFSLENSKEVYQTALNEALTDAQEKARVIANHLQVSLNPIPVKITEQVNESHVQLKAFAATESSTPIEPGQIRIDARLEVIFEY